MSAYLEFLANFGIGGAHPGGLPLTKTLLEKEKIRSETKVLDAGCGTGQTSAYLARKFQCNVTAIDNHTVMINKAAKRFSKENVDITLVYGSIEQLPFEDQSFDLVLAESVTVFTDIGKTLGEYARVLKPNGVLLAIEMTKEGPLSDEEIEQVKSFYSVKHVLSEEEWIGMLKNAGFQKVESFRVHNTDDTTSLEKLSEFELSESIDFHMFSIWMRHQDMMERLYRRLKYRVYRATSIKA